jgi:plasmid stability protein
MAARADWVKALKERAAKHSRSAEQEHREILKAALRAPRRQSLVKVLAAIPDVGQDEDFSGGWRAYPDAPSTRCRWASRPPSWLALQSLTAQSTPAP